MNTYQRISMELKNYFAEQRVFRILLPWDMIFIFGCAGIMVLNKFISVGGLLSTIAYYGFFLGLILAFANLNNRFVYSGFFIYAVLNAYDVIYHGVLLRMFRFLDYHSLITLIIFGYLGYLVYKQEIKISAKINQNGGV
ncbi:MAG: hypothetical protein PHS83_06090 [Clostridia bacterium]|nr:hypothetical protein [Clostridia bacterium]MDD4665193.1 hypothetical protein [Clostridia bacterium]